MLQKTSLKARTGGQVLVDQLLIHGADTAYCVPGESYLEVLDALHDVQDRFTLINARHEAGAANMALDTHAHESVDHFTLEASQPRSSSMLLKVSSA